MKREKDLLAIYSENCLKCGHFVQGVSRKFKDCHESKGNKQCPASEVEVVVVGKAAVYASKLLKAQDRRDAVGTAKIFAYVAKQPAGFQAKFYDAIEKSGISIQSPNSEHSDK